MTEGNAEPTPRVCGGEGPKVPGVGVADVWNGPEGGYPARVMQTFCITI